jgi:hypothetical protein
LKALEGGVWKTRIAEPEPAKGYLRWRGDEAARKAVYANRPRLKSGIGRETMRRRGELVERSFAHVLDRGGLRRAWLRGRENIHKRYLIHVAGFNLGVRHAERGRTGRKGLHFRLTNRRRAGIRPDRRRRRRMRSARRHRHRADIKLKTGIHQRAAEPRRGESLDARHDCVSRKTVSAADFTQHSRWRPSSLKAIRRSPATLFRRLRTTHLLQLDELFDLGDNFGRHPTHSRHSHLRPKWAGLAESGPSVLR